MYGSYNTQTAVQEARVRELVEHASLNEASLHSREWRILPRLREVMIKLLARLVRTKARALGLVLARPSRYTSRVEHTA